MPSKKNRRFLIYFLLIALALGAVGYFFWSRGRHAFPPNSAAVQRRTIRETIELSGEVTAEKYARLHFPAGGLVTYAPYQEGDQVKKWSTVASLDARELEKNLTKQLNLYAQARHSFDTTQDTYQKEKDDGDIDQALRRILEDAQYDLDNSVIEVEIRDLALKLSRLTSPLDGILVSSPVTTPYVYVAATDTWDIVDPNSLAFTADLDESDLSKVKPGQEATIKLDAYPDLALSSQVERIAYESKLVTTGTIFEIKLPLPSEYLSQLRLGLNGNVSILRQTHENVLTIPLEAVKETPSGPTVKISRDGRPFVQEVKLGVSDDQYYEVVEGLSDGQTIYYGK